MKTLLRDPAAGIMHSLIYFSFLVLLAVTTVLEINHQMPESLKFLHGGVYKAYSAVGDFAGLTLLAGVLWRSEEHTSELPSLMRISYAVFCLKKKTKQEYASQDDK